MKDKKENTISKLKALGFVKDKKMNNIYWLHGHCALVKENGEVEEL